MLDWVSSQLQSGSFQRFSRPFQRNAYSFGIVSAKTKKAHRSKRKLHLARRHKNLERSDFLGRPTGVRPNPASFPSALLEPAVSVPLALD